MLPNARLPRWLIRRQHDGFGYYWLVTDRGLGHEYAFEEWREAMWFTHVHVQA